jgi:hypothetical protein
MGIGFPVFASAIQTIAFPNRLLAGSGAGRRPLGAHSGAAAAALSPTAPLSVTLSVPATEPTEDSVAAAYVAPRPNWNGARAVSAAFAAGFAVESALVPRFGSAGILSHPALKASTRDETANLKRPGKFL